MTVIMGYTDQTGASAATADPSWGSECFVHTDRTYVAVSGAVVTKVWVYGRGSGVFRVAFYTIVSGVPVTRVSQPVVVPVGSSVGWYSVDCKIPLPSVGTQYGAGMEFFVDVASDFYFKAGPGGTQMVSESRQWLPASWTNNGTDSNVIVFYAEVTEGGVSTTGGTNTWTLVASLTQGSPDTNAYTTSAINTTGANLLVVNHAEGTGTTTLTDSKSNTWVLSTVTPWNNGSNFDRLYYCANPTVGTGHTFSSSGGSSTMSIAAFSGASTNPFDVAGGDSANASTIKPGAIFTPETNMLVVTGMFHNDTATSATIDNSFTISGQQLQVNGAHYGGGLAYKVIASPSSVDPTWTGGAFQATSIASFKAGGTASAFAKYRTFNGSSDLVTWSLGNLSGVSSNPQTFVTVMRLNNLPGDAVLMFSPGYDPVDWFVVGGSQLLAYYDGATNAVDGPNWNPAGTPWRLGVVRVFSGSAAKWSVSTYNGTSWPTPTHTTSGSTFGSRTYPSSGVLTQGGTPAINADIICIARFDTALTDAQINNMINGIGAIQGTAGITNLWMLGQTTPADLVGTSTLGTLTGTTLSTGDSPFPSGGTGGGPTSDDPLPARWDYRSSITRR